MTKKKKNKKDKPPRTIWDLEDMEHSFILECLEHHNLNRTHTAAALGIALRTLRNKLIIMRKRGLVVDDYGVIGIKK